MEALLAPISLKTSPSIAYLSVGLLSIRVVLDGCTTMYSNIIARPRDISQQDKDNDASKELEKLKAELT